MRITKLRIRNFRSIKQLDMDLGETTVLIGQNNSGKTAILDAVRIVLTRRWGQRGTGFTENDVHRPDERTDPRVLPPVSIEITMEEPSIGVWDADMVAALEDILAIKSDGRSVLTLRVTCAWNEEKDCFDPLWEFLDHTGAPMSGKAQRATNFTGFFGYVPLFWLGALRDAADEFTPRSNYWGKLLKTVRIPEELEAEALRILSELDTKIISADPKLAAIAELIGQSTHVSIADGPGAARLNALPLSVEDMLQRTGIVLRQENSRPWLPLGHHGQGLQSLAVIFLFQAAVLQHIQDCERPGVEPIFTIEEPEAHLHPQAARTLWERIAGLSGQKLVTTHSPYFVHHVPLRDLRLVRLKAGCTEFSAIPRQVVSTVPWTPAVDGLVRGASAAKIFVKDLTSGNVAARSWFDQHQAEALKKCYRSDGDFSAKATVIDELRHASRVLPSGEDEEDLSFHGRRVRGEIFFARGWILVEGVCEYLLIHAIAKALGYPLDVHGFSVIDFQLSGSAGIYPALATALNLPWHMIMDGDPAGGQFKDQLITRGFLPTDLSMRVKSLTPPNDLEDQLLADGHEQLLRDILFSLGMKGAKTCPISDFRAQLKNRKTDYMSKLSVMVAADPALAHQMPQPFVELIRDLQAGLT